MTKIHYHISTGYVFKDLTVLGHQVGNNNSNGQGNMGRTIVKQIFLLLADTKIFSSKAIICSNTKLGI